MWVIEPEPARGAPLPSGVSEAAGKQRVRRLVGRQPGHQPRPVEPAATSRARAGLLKLTEEVGEVGHRSSQT